MQTLQKPSFREGGFPKRKRLDLAGVNLPGQRLELYGVGAVGERIVLLLVEKLLARRVDHAGRLLSSGA